MARPSKAEWLVLLAAVVIGAALALFVFLGANATF